MRTDPRVACANERQRFWWAVLHDLVAHPLMALTGWSKWALRFHDWTSHRAWPRREPAQWRWPALTTRDQKVVNDLSIKLRAQGKPFVVTATPMQCGPLGLTVEYVYTVERI